MSQQYFTSSPTSAHKYERFSVSLLDQSLTFVTDAGVFSKGEVDYGTRVLLTALPPLSGRVLDLGCGWGAIGVTIGKKYPDIEIVMGDVNERALELTRRNLSENGVKNAKAVCSDAFQNIEGSFDFIITNPPIRTGKQVIYSMFDTAFTRLVPGGRMYIVIRKQQGAESALKHLKEIYSRAEMILRDKGYWIIECEKGCE
ncbi:MAG: class I SAM-dependent methyltransferase [Clostridia bacterium]|nr:class I SAM-dependent methyltransferase [Clostridia bacterium]